MPWSSNHTYLARVCHRGTETLAIYKPRRGERPLWDFTAGTLCQRETASYVLSEALGWSIVPFTVLRDGPAGPGMVQQFVNHDPEDHFFTLREQHGDRFRQFALFDVVANNADRKSGHCLLGPGGHIWGIDHGLTFHCALKLRTVIWDYEGEPIPDALAADLARLAADLDEHGEWAQQLGALLAGEEMVAARGRLEWLLENGVFPPPFTDYPYPWPMV
jgi:uncharacterized repeat protein (TIGR03843 family)